LRINPSKLKLTTVQHFSPEINLYTFKNSTDRLANLLYFPLHLPFWGEWRVSQGYDGEYTHKGDWGKALDFVILDENEKTYKSKGLLCENYYCYNKPVLAPADGIVEDIVDKIDDNGIGQVNTDNNWGNTIIIRHLSGLYTQMSHLKKGSFKVSKGDFVRQGDIVAACGNSGRSPEPHLHFQVQTTPLLGAKTLFYPISYFNQNQGNCLELRQYSVPRKEELISGVVINPLLKAAFNIMPDTSVSFRYMNESAIEVTEKWDAYTDAYNKKYLYCKATESLAYYVNDGTMFYFTAFYGDKKSLLYYFYLSAYKVYLAGTDQDEINDALPLDTINHKRISVWLHDFIAPFFTYLRVNYTLSVLSSDIPANSGYTVLRSEITVSNFGKIRNESSSSLILEGNKIKEISFETAGNKIKAICIS
jgi:murein DD-endopeptidase MepM/ murein hydrolase activator NlpD